MSPTFMWVLAAFFGIPSLYDFIEGIWLRMGEEVFFATGPLARVILVGYICFGLAVGSFLVNVFGTALRVFG
ncbi:hypothetical protein [Massilia sp. ST3]|uniref:hypothetical protein n=1 Tax=Massilia sp. ST3 TaxID=2824903 RepID=UPI001B8331EC|nr:hypothetical protein [Massilia sp. ST3]MBQ5949475.1 hypothetical protein [Massilia sp. ST3]